MKTLPKGKVSSYKKIIRSKDNKGSKLINEYTELIRASIKTEDALSIEQVRGELSEIVKRFIFKFRLTKEEIDYLGKINNE